MKAKKELLVVLIVIGALVIMLALWHSWQQHTHIAPTSSPNSPAAMQ